jgi:hypothetical protein
MNVYQNVMVTAVMADRLKDLNYILTTDIVPVSWRIQAREHRALRSGDSFAFTKYS